MLESRRAAHESSALEVTPTVDADSSDPAARRRMRHHHAPGLDGVRGVAVAAVTAYHLGFMDGGLLSVSVFFTLSGYLITSILLSGWGRSGAVDLRGFWLRRARRLLPALLVLLPVVLLASAIARPSKLASYARQASSALFYVANWATIARGDTYFNRFSGPGPFDHLWSLAIEEQFYAVWPLLLLGLLLVGRRLGGPDRGRGVARRAPIAAMVVTGLLAIASALTMAWRYVPNAMNNARAYEGTDARAAPILVGALAAMLLPLGELGEGGRRRRIALDVAGALSCFVVAWVVVTTNEYSPFLYRGGDSLVAIASAALILAAGHPSTLVGKAFGVGPLRWLGVRTYGIYLWHLPVVAFMPTSMLEGRPAARAALQVALILGVASLSWTLLEDPIRRDGVIAVFTRRERRGWAVGRRWAGVVALVGAATLALGAWPVLSPASASEKDTDVLMAELEANPPEARPIELATVAGSATVNETAPARETLLTACSRVVHVGDSTSLGLMSKKYLPRPEDRLDAQYGAVGVKLFVPEISGGRAVVEKLNGQPSAYELVAAKSATGYAGCWVFAFGMGDAATTGGNVPGLTKRIGWMMAAAAGAPVLWTTTKTLLDKGPYRDANMEGWNHALVQACARHPNMRVYDWASEVQDDWYLADEIHPNETGSKERAARVARALAIAFPKDGPPPVGCVVRSTP